MAAISGLHQKLLSSPRGTAVGWGSGGGMLSREHGSHWAFSLEEVPPPLVPGPKDQGLAAGFFTLWSDELIGHRKGGLYGRLHRFFLF
jgi:hypothetical protein